MCHSSLASSTKYGSHLRSFSLSLPSPQWPPTASFRRSFRSSFVTAVPSRSLARRSRPRPSVRPSVRPSDRPTDRPSCSLEGQWSKRRVSIAARQKAIGRATATTQESVGDRRNAKTRPPGGPFYVLSSLQGLGNDKMSYLCPIIVPASYHTLSGAQCSPHIPIKGC